jgi:hypothetical protein
MDGYNWTFSEVCRRPGVDVASHCAVCHQTAKASTLTDPPPKVNKRQAPCHLVCQILTELGDLSIREILSLLKQWIKYGQSTAARSSTPFWASHLRSHPLQQVLLGPHLPETSGHAMGYDK